jgi:D-beta-D-heptose 7-phosphate kinase/D-beta-D-heptose 1-phosphate adenosyltransferase
MHNHKTVAVIGDVMLDEFVYGDVNRISPEASTPVLQTRRTEYMPGGAANVARGVCAMGCDADLVTVIGDDTAGRQYIKEIKKLGHSLIPWFGIDNTRPTTCKTRFVSEQHHNHLLRVDRESSEPVSGDVLRRLSIASHTAINERDVSVIVFSDYCKGMLPRYLVEQLVPAACATNKTVIVDTKGDVAPYRGATIVKLNLRELGFPERDPDDKAVADAAHAMCADNEFKHVVVTRGEGGLTMYSRDAVPLHLPGHFVRVRDVSGAGDTVVAVLAAMIAKGCDIPTALFHANRAAAIAVSKPGTSVVSLAELEGDGKITHASDWALLDQRLREWRGLHIGFTNGCFDIMHEGHVGFLATARAHCDKLIVGLNDDESVSRLKGPDRPVQPVRERAAVLAAMDAVDLVVVFAGDDPSDVCERVRPHTLFKGSEYDYSQIAGRQFAVKTHIVPRLPDENSTTKIIERVRTSDPNVAHRSLDYVPITGPGVDALERRTPEAMKQVDEYLRGKTFGKQ